MSNAEKPMGACASSLREVTVVAVPGRMPRAVSMAGQHNQEAGARVSVLWHPLVVGPEPIRLP